mmetsp:Transcript_42509/g.97398  ORF Transcript_42509/g.97398 Transcript_42509/m.97398 type:complete len:326 (-) Transcript_42509:7-984(-)
MPVAFCCKALSCSHLSIRARLAASVSSSAPSRADLSAPIPPAFGVNVDGALVPTARSPPLRGASLLTGAAFLFVSSASSSFSSLAADLRSARRSLRSLRAVSGTVPSGPCDDDRPVLVCPTSKSDSLLSLSMRGDRSSGLMLDNGSRAMESSSPFVYLVTFGGFAFSSDNRAIPLKSSSSASALASAPPPPPPPFLFPLFPRLPFPLLGPLPSVSSAPVAGACNGPAPTGPSLSLAAPFPVLLSRCCRDLRSLPVASEVLASASSSLPPFSATVFFTHDPPSFPALSRCAGAISPGRAPSQYNSLSCNGVLVVESLSPRALLPMA